MFLPSRRAPLHPLRPPPPPAADLQTLNNEVLRLPRPRPRALRRVRPGEFCFRGRKSGVEILFVFPRVILLDWGGYNVKQRSQGVLVFLLCSFSSSACLSPPSASRSFYFFREQREAGRDAFFFSNLTSLSHQQLSSPSKKCTERRCRQGKRGRRRRRGRHHLRRPRERAQGQGAQGQGAQARRFLLLRGYEVVFFFFFPFRSELFFGDSTLNFLSFSLPFFALLFKQINSWRGRHRRQGCQGPQGLQALQLRRTPSLERKRAAF